MKSSTRAANSRKFTSWFYASLFLATFLFSSSAMAQVANIAAGFAGAEAGEWGGQNGAVIGMPDGTCAAMGAVGKVNLVSGFGFSIPGSATITTLTAYIKAGESTPQPVSAQLATNAAVDPPTPIGAARMYPTAGTGNNCAGTQISALGTTLADWGNPALTPAIVNNPAFGMIFIKIQTSNVKFDSICMEIGYDTAAGPAVQESCTGVVPPSNTIRVIKAVEGAPPGTDWAYTGTAPVTGFTLPAGGGFQDFADLTDGTYTITETTKPGYIVTSECTLNDVVVATGNEQISVDVSGDGTFSCVFTNTSTTGSVTVIKDFSDDDPAAVNMTLTCTSGSITTNPLPASEGSPAVFEVTGFTAGATCTATEAATPGYAQDISDCQRAGISAVNGVCTMVNTLNAGQFAVIKDFSDNNPAPIDMTLTCTSGTIGPANPLPASEGSPALFTVTGALQGATCTATEAATPGYTQDISGCQAGGLLADGGSCTMVNTLNDFSFTVNKDFSDDATDSVDVTLTCSSGMITTNPLPASEASPAVFQITGALPDATCTATEGPTPGYVQDDSACAVQGLLADGGSCTIVNTLRVGSFGVFKNFSDDSPAAVDMTLTCTSGVVTTNPLPASEAAEANFEITGYELGATCTATEAATPGYTQDISGCQDGDPIGSACIMQNTLNDFSFTVNKDFSDDATDSVDMTLTCSSGNITTNPVAATEAAPAVFQITGALPDATCTATEAATPGYTQDISGCQVGGLLADGGSCTMVNTLNDFSFTVNKDFSDDATDSVDMTLTCSSGNITTNPVAATEAAPAVFQITGALPDATCTATEAATPGYTQDISGCQVGGLLADGGSCTMVNTLNDFSFTVNKDFSDDATDSVDMTLTCSSGNITTNPVAATEAAPAVFQITGALADATCTATEAATPGYSQDISGCQVGGLLADGGSCTMINSMNAFNFTVNKDFSDDATDSVDMTLTCSSGSVTTNPVAATEASPAVFEITGALSDATCTATEAATPGYSQNIDGCQAGGLLADGGSCTMVNTLTNGTFSVIKDFSDDNPGPVEITLTCSGGDITTNPLPAAEGAPAFFEITGFEFGVTCTATEAATPGYDQDISQCQAPDLSANGGSCTMVNTLREGTFTVRKLFSDDNPMSVSVTASCTSGTVTNNPQPASMGGSAIFNVTGFEDGATCTASEAVPDGYEADISDCQDGDPINGGCAITNTLIPRTTFRVLKDFTDDNPMDVEVTIDCFTGLPITQTQSINEQQDVVFIVESFEPGELDCEISEVVPTGYTPTYTASLGEAGMSNVPPYSDADGCYFDEVINGEFICEIVNEPNLVDIVIEKLWIIEGMGGDSVDQNFRLTLYCDAQIVGGQANCGGGPGPVMAGGPIPAYQTCLVMNGYGNEIFTPQARPDYPSSHCWVVETVYDDSVEVDNGCLNLEISAAEGGDSCLITNTVFFEGIPTLNQYGMLLLALLMLGVGLVGFRRFA